MKTNQLPYVIGITGGSASGKTFFLHSLLSHFSEEEVCLISQDNYYKSLDAVPVDENGVENFDLPAAIDFETYAKHIKDLKNGKIVHQKEYAFNNPNAIPKILEFKPCPFIVVEGIFVFHSSEVSDLLDLKVFIDAKEHIKIKRRIIRDNNERGYDLDDVLYRWETTWLLLMKNSSNLQNVMQISSSITTSILKWFKDPFIFYER